MGLSDMKATHEQNHLSKWGKPDFTKQQNPNYWAEGQTTSWGEQPFVVYMGVAKYRKIRVPALLGDRGPHKVSCFTVFLCASKTYVKIV